MLSSQKIHKMVIFIIQPTRSFMWRVGIILIESHYTSYYWSITYQHMQKHQQQLVHDSFDSDGHLFSWL